MGRITKKRSKGTNREMKKRIRRIRQVVILVILTMVGIFAYDSFDLDIAKLLGNGLEFGAVTAEDVEFDIPPEYSGSAYVTVNGNKPLFDVEKYGDREFESFSSLDYLGRCGPAFANLSPETMPEGERGSIGMVKPSGWHTVTYPEVISDRYLYNRCHLIAWCLSGENANEKNLITGTRYMNISGMLPFEEQVASYIEATGNHVLYRVTPDFRDKNLIANGVWMEAYSVEDSGRGICFSVYCYNVQPGIEIDYATGDSRQQWENN